MRNREKKERRKEWGEEGREKGRNGGREIGIERRRESNCNNILVKNLLLVSTEIHTYLNKNEEEKRIYLFLN